MAGIYRVEMRGGSGGKPYGCDAGTGTLNAKSDVLSTIFKLNTETVVYSFRGGDIVTCKSVSDGCAELVTANGGTGGVSVFYSCGGQTAVSYGGGGGGSYSVNYPSVGALDGGDGGSGSTGTSDVSFLRIYKM